MRNSTLITLVIIFVTWGADLAFCRNIDVNSSASFVIASVDDMMYEDALANIQAILMQETQIATKTKLNADFVPGIVTVLRGDELERMGVRTVGEALAFVPNMPSETGYPTSVRGLSSSLLAGKFKNLIDSIPVNNNVLGGYGDGGLSPFYLPIEQIERIEVIRGPGGTLYGKWAYLGVINIVTKKEGNRIFSRIGSFDMVHGGAILSHRSDDENFRTSLKLSGWKHGKTGLMVGQDALYGTPNEAVSQAPGLANDMRRFYTLIMDMSYKDFSIDGFMAHLDKDSSFGLFNLAFPPPSDDNVAQYGNRYLRGKWQGSFTFQVDFEAKFGWRQFIEDPWQNWLFPPGYAVYDKAGNQLTPSYPGGWQIGPYVKEEVLFGGFDLQWTVFSGHTILTAFEYEDIIKLDHYIRKNIDQYYMPLAEAQIFSEDYSWLAPDINRDVVSIVFQDQWELNNRMTVTGGLRYDKYSDVDDIFTPRLSAVYQLSENHIFKGQYAEGFRPPTLVEMYFSNNPISLGNPNLEAETVHTWELGYIYRSSSFVSRLTLFFSDLKKLIGVDDNGIYYNSNDARTMGSEIEVDWDVNQYISLKTGFSFSDTEDKESGEQVADSVNWLGHCNLFIHNRDKLSLSILYRFVGETNRAIDDPRDKLKSMNIFDLTIGKVDLIRSGLSVRGGIKNIFDEDIRSPSSYPGYVDDFPRAGRSLWLALDYAF